MPNLTGAWRAL